MKIEIKPHSLKNLENICEVLYKLHPEVLDYLVDMQRSIGNIMGVIDLEKPTLEEREFLTSCKIVSIEKDLPTEPCNKLEEICNSVGENFLNSFDKYLIINQDFNIDDFYRYKKKLKLNTDEYIPMTISIEIEDPVIGRKVRELVRALETTSAPEQFTMNKEELDIDAYFAEGYGLTMNEEQKKKVNDFYDKNDPKYVIELLLKEKIHLFK